MKKILSLTLILSVLMGLFTTVPVNAETESAGIELSKTDRTAYNQERINYYESFEDYDQQVYPDEEFFGTWNSATNSWDVEGVFDYEGTPELAEVEQAVKEGNYTAAKEELLPYFREKLLSHNYARTSRYTSKEYRLMAEMVMEGFTLRANSCLPVGRHTLTETPQWTTTDVLTRLKEDLASGNPAMNFRIYDTKKDGYMTRLWTKENSENKPYIKLVVNDETRIYYPTADNTIRSGEYANTGYTTEPYMYANESYTSINWKYSIDNPEKQFATPADLLGATGSSQDDLRKDYAYNLEEKPVDGYTMQGCLLFDFSDVSQDDTITVAELYLYGDMQRDGNPGNDASLEEKTTTDFFVVDDRSSLNWSEIDHCWNKEGMNNTFCYDREYGPNLCRPTEQAGASWMAVCTNTRFVIQALGSLYRGMRDETYAYHAIRLIKNITYKLGDRHWLVDNAIMERAVANQELIMEMYTLIHSEWMTPEDFTIILKNIYSTTEYMIYGWNSTCEANNIGSICNTGLSYGALFLTEFKNFDTPVSDELIDESRPGSFKGGYLPVALKRMVYKIKDTVYEDGTSIEVPIGYIQTNLSNATNIFDRAEAVGMGHLVAGALEQEDKELLIKAAHNAINLSSPIHGTWQTGDDSVYTTTVSSSLAKKFLKITGVDDPILKWASTQGKEGTPNQEATSYVSDIGIKATLRSDWSHNAVAMYMDADGGGNWSHSQSDDLAIALMAYGKFMLTDPLSCGYNSTESVATWMHSTRAHNTIEINNANQRCHLYEGGTDVEEPFGETLNLPMISGRLGSLSDTRPLKEDENSNEIPDSGETMLKKRYLGNLYDYIRGETKGYINNDVVQEDFETARYVLFLKPGFFIVTDHINPETDTSTNSYKQAWHVHHDMSFELEENTNNIVTKSSNSANIIVAPVDGKADITPTLRRGYYSVSGANSNNLVLRQYVTYDRKTSGDTVYNTVLYPTRVGEEKQITTSEVTMEGIKEGEATAFTAMIEDTKNGGSNELFYYNVLDETKKADRKVGYYKTDSLLAYAEKNANGQHTEYILKNGTHISIDGGKALLENGTTELTDIGIKIENNVMSIEVRDEAELDSTGAFRVYCESPLTKVLVNDKSVYFEKVDNYIYLKETGMEQDKEETTTQQPTTPEHSAGSTGGFGGGGVTVDKDEDKDKENEPSDTTDTKPEEITIPEEFADELNNHWAKTEMAYMVNKGFVKGDGGSLNLSGEVTRAEFVSVIVRALNLKTEEYQGIFKDVKSGDWYAQSIESAYKHGLLSGYDGYADPNAVITREQMAKILVNAYEFVNGPVNDKTASDYKDSSAVSNWAEEYIDKCTHLALMNGYDDGNFKPQANTKRAEAFVTIYRLITKQ